MRALAQIDYTGRDFTGIGATLERYIRQRFPEWTDFNTSNVGNVMKELAQYVGDTLNYYIDRQANECFFDSATSRENLLSLCRWLGYEPRGYVAASAAIQVTLAQPTGATFVLPRGTQVKTRDALPLVFELTTDCTITPGNTAGVASAKHARTWREVFEADGSPNQSFSVARAQCLNGSVRVYVDGVEWICVESLFDVKTAATAYMLSSNAEFVAGVRFGDGQFGAAPAGRVEVVYQTGGGSAGNVPAGALSIIEGAFADMSGRPVSVSVTNPNPASGGMDPETLDEIRWRAPRSVKTSGRTITREDFEINAEGVTGVVRALAVTRNEIPALPENFTRVHVVPSGGGDPSPYLLEQVRAELLYKKPVMLTHEFEVVGARYVPVNIQGTVYARPGRDPEDVRTDIEKRLAEYLNYTALDPAGEPVLNFGRPVYVSQLVAMIQGVAGVRSVTLTSPSADIEPGIDEIPSQGTIDLAVVVI